MQISPAVAAADVRPLLEVLVADDRPGTTFALLERVNPRRHGDNPAAWRERQVHLLTALASAHAAGLLTTLPRAADEVTERFMLTARGHDLLSVESTRPFARVGPGERPADTPPPPVERRAGRWVLTRHTSARSA